MKLLSNQNAKCTIWDRAHFEVDTPIQKNADKIAASCFDTKTLSVYKPYGSPTIKRWCDSAIVDRGNITRYNHE